MKYLQAINNHAWLVMAFVVAAGVLIVAALQPWSPSPPEAARPQFTQITTTPAFQRALYSGAVLDSNGGIDIARTLDRAVQVNANTYFYLIWDRAPKASHSPQKPSSIYSVDAWAKLPTFATEAAKRGIKVVVYLVPPTESDPKTYRPFGWNYAAWFSAIGRLAAKHHNVVGIALDDLGTNLPSAINERMHPGLPKLSIADLASYRAHARKFAAGIEFLPVLYSNNLFGSTSQLRDVRRVADGIIYPFAGLENLTGGHLNTVDPQGLLSSVASIRALTSCAGAPTCWQVTFATPGTATASADLPGWPPRSSLQLRLTSDALAGAGRTYAVRAAVDGRIIAEVVTRDGRVAILLPDISRGRHTISISFISKQTADSASPDLIVDSLAIVSRGPHSGPTSHRPVPRWTLRGSNGGGVTFTLVHRMKLIVMYYCARFGAEGDVNGAADANYLMALIPQLESVASKGLADGLVAYRLNLISSRESSYRGDPANYPIVREMYRLMRPRRG